MGTFRLFIFLTVVATYSIVSTSSAVIPFIIGGEAAERNEIPYQISVRRDGKHICGGALLSVDFVVTAAHCVEIGNLNSFTVVAGDYSLLNDDGTEQQANASNILIHESYDSWTLANDIALIRLKNPLNLTQAVQVIPLPGGGVQFNGTATLSGWGDLGPDEERKLSDILQKVEVSLVSDAICMDAYPLLILDGMLCAGYADGGKDACRGDAGDPLVCLSSGRPYLCGIFSWGHSICGEPDFPGVYTKIQYFTDWILSNAEISDE